MPQQQIMWTALPNGRRGEGASEKIALSVVVSPKLRFDDGGTGELQAFADFLDWPAHLAQLVNGFDIIVDDDEGHPLPAVVVPGTPHDSGLWRALFVPSTLVRSQKFEDFRQPVASYPVHAVAGQLEAGYGNLGRDAPFRPSDKATFKQHFADIANLAAPEGGGGSPPGAHHVDARASGASAQMHLELAASLLRYNPEFAVEDKLEQMISVAGERARSNPVGQHAPLVPAIDHPAASLLQFAAFHRRPKPRGDMRIALERASPADEIDFHRMLTALGDYPWLLRRLGLIIDLEAEASLLPKSKIGALRHLGIRPKFSSPGGEASSYRPVTKYIFDDAVSDNPLPFPVFVAAPRAATAATSVLPTLEIVGGLLNLQLPRNQTTDDLQFDIISFDVDGAGKKILNAVELLAREKPDSLPIDSSAEMPAPALQSTGFALVRAGRADMLMNDISTAGALEGDRLAGRSAVVFAEDLIRGYRIDIRRFAPGHRPGIDPDPPWMSLHQRIGDFRFKRDGAEDIVIPHVADEGFVQPVLAQEPNATETSPIYIHESYGHWQGWSLSAPLPLEPLKLGSDQPNASAPAALKRVDVTIEAAPGSLPRLRFGHTYQLRVRTVDVAGNGLRLNGAQDVLDALAREGRPEPYLPIQFDELPFRRFDPIASPVLVPREVLTEGEAIDVMVIRSNGSTTASYAAGLGDPKYKGFNERHVAPPKSTQRMAERHGRLDSAFGIGGQPQKQFAICRRNDGTLNDTAIINIQTGAPEELADVVRRDPSTGAAVETVPHGLRFVASNPSAQGAATGYTVHYEERLRLPYLPDPLARGAALFGLPGLNNESLVLEEGASGAAGRLKSLREEEQLLPQRAIDELGLVTKIGFPSKEEWPDLRTFRLRLDGADQTSASSTPSWSEANGARILTVFLAPAETKTVWLSSYPDVEDVSLFGLHFWWLRLGAPEGKRHFLNMAQHGALGMLTPARKIELVHAVQQPLIAPTVDGVAFETRRFPATTAAYLVGRFKIHGRSTEKLDLFASWSEPLQDSESAQTFETHVLEFVIHPDLEPLGPNANPVPIGDYTKGPDFFEFRTPQRPEDTAARSWLARHEFGDTKHRRVTYRLVATTRFKEYFPERITRDKTNITRVTAIENVVVHNSVRPPALEIKSIIPAFQWSRDTELTSSIRLGGRLRVYLGSQWFATGEGEALAIVGDVEAGVDPIHATPSAAQRTSMTPVGPDAVMMTIPERGLTKIYPFPAHFDTGVSQWYADLAFDVTDTYFPFIKLALARFQEHSAQGVQQLSPIVEAGFYQLLPDRAVAIARFDVVEGQPDKRKIEITVSGARAPAATLAAGGSVSYLIEVDVEERAKSQPNDQRDKHLGWKRSTTIFPVVSTATLPPTVLWKGHVIAPAFAEMELRIVIKEFELFPAATAPPGQAWTDDPAGAGGPSRRLVYADVVSLQ